MQPNRVNRLWKALLAAAFLATAGFSVTIYGAPGDCCGIETGGGDCIFDYPYIACDTNGHCENPYFPVCCPADGFCS